MGAKPYDTSSDPKAAWLWLDRVNKIYRVMGYTDDQIEKRFSELVRLVSYIQVKALRVEKSTTAMYQSRQESKRSALGTSQ